MKELKQAIINNNHLEDDELEDILEDQAEFVKANNSKRLERTKRKLVKLINETEINQLCQLQTEITQLEIKLSKNINQSTKQLTKIINNIGSINIQQGNAIIGGKIGNNANFSYNNQQANDWINLHSVFANQNLINQWKNQGFSHQATQDWANAFGNQFNPNELAFYLWLRDIVKLNPFEELNNADLNELRRRRGPPEGS